MRSAGNRVARLRLETEQCGNTCYTRWLEMQIMWQPSGSPQAISQGSEMIHEQVHQHRLGQKLGTWYLVNGRTFKGLPCQAGAPPLMGINYPSFMLIRLSRILVCGFLATVTGLASEHTAQRLQPDVF